MSFFSHSLEVSRRTRDKEEVGIKQSSAALNLIQKQYKYGTVFILGSDE